MILLGILVVACTAGSLIPQGQTYAWYAEKYSERTAALIVATHLDDAFHSWWFILINAFLCINLIACNLVRLPSLIRRTKNYAKPDENPVVSAPYHEDINTAFTKMKMSGVKEMEKNGHRVLFSFKHRIGLWGAWVCHLGVLLLIVGYSLGQMTYKEYAVYGVPGDTLAVPGTSLAVTIDDFRIELREDDTVEQYTADITAFDLSKSSEGKSATISVNHPADLLGYRFYQNSTGWAANITILKNGEYFQSKVVCAGDYLPVQDKPELVIYFNAFYPDYQFIEGYGPSTRSGKVLNPAYLYSVYYMGQMLGMNVLSSEDVLTIDEYTVYFSEPQSYTLIQIKKDSFTWLAFVGALVIIAGLFLAFYIQPQKLWAVEEEDGSWTVKASCKKGDMLFRRQFETEIEGKNKDASY